MEYKIDWNFLQEYVEGRKKHKNYRKSLDVYHHLTFHADGYYIKPWGALDQKSSNNLFVNPYFQRIIDSRRPSETEAILAYRRLNYLPITKVPFNKVVSSLKKIVKCADWHIDYSKSEIPTSLPSDMSLERYCEKLYPKDDSIENWSYKSLVRWLLIDPNALVCVMPLSWEEEPGVLLRPYAHIILCKDVYEYKEGELCIFLSPYVNDYMDSEGNKKNGKIFITVTKNCYYETKQITDEQYETIEHIHNIGEMPAFLLGGESKTPDVFQPFYESFVQSMIPSLDAAARDSSDLDAEKVQHLFSTMWHLQMQNCNTCSGSGKVNKNGAQTICSECEGRGVPPKSPYRDIEINLNNSLSQDKNVPIPPAGYIVKPTEMVALMRNEITTEIYDALSAVNMEFLCEAPLNQSGKAKEIDRDELNNFVYSIAYHIVSEIINPIYWFINEIRYKTAVPDLITREKMLPYIPVPQDFTFLTNKDAADNLIKIAASTVSGEIKDLAEMDFIHSAYQDQPETRNRLMAIHQHDPLRGYSVEQIESLMTSGFIKKIDAVLSIYISSFIDELMANENYIFLTYDFEKQKVMLYDMAQTKLDEIESDKPEPAPIVVMPQPENVAAETPEKIDNLEINEDTKPRKTERNDLNRA